MMTRKGQGTINVVLIISILLLTFYIVATQIFPKNTFLVRMVESKTVQQLQLAVRECQIWHEERDFMEHLVDSTGLRYSLSEAGLNGEGATVNCCSKGSPGCDTGASIPAECVKKCAAVLKLHSECAKYYPPDADCYKDDVTRLEVEG